jgi:hypothetical protein
MASKNFKPEKAAKVTGGYASTFGSSVAQANAKGSVSASATADPWAKTLNVRDWESPTAETDNPNDDV